MSLKAIVTGAVVATATSVVGRLAIGVDATLFMTFTAALAAANVVEACGLLKLWGGRWHVVAWETLAVFGGLNWVSVDVLLFVLVILLTGVLAWLRHVTER